MHVRQRYYFIPYKFQFLKGAIKWLSAITTAITFFTFQFLKGAIKCIVMGTTQRLDEVSIP